MNSRVSLDTVDVAQRILRQRATRYTDSGPTLPAAETARFRLEAGRLRVAYASAPQGHSHELVTQVLRFAEPRRLQVQWTVVPQRSGESELAAALEEASFRPIEDLLLMAHADQLLGTYSHPQISIVPIASWHLMLAYEYGSRLSFYSEPHPIDTAVSQRATDRWREQQSGWYHYYAALCGGQLVGGCYISLFEDIPTLMGVYTLPEMRKRGVASQLIAKVINDTVSPEHTTCCLFVERGNPAQALYLQLGFIPLLDMLTYNLDLRSVE